MFRRFRAAAAGWSEDDASHMGAALAYYSLFSLAPLLLIAIAVIGAFYGPQEARQRVVAEVAELSDQQTAEAVGTLLESVGKHRSAAAPVVGAASLLFGAMGMFTCLRASLRRIWRLPPLPEHFALGFLRNYLVALVMVLVTCGFLVLTLAVSTAVPLLYPRLQAVLPQAAWATPAVDFLMSVLMLTLLFLFTFRFLSDGRLRYRQLFGGAATSAFLFAAGKMLIGLYLSYVNLASAYGAAGSLVVVLAWVYYSAQIVFFGAEVVRAGLPAPAR